ncbi:MAG: AAA family ATPase [Chloroflexi bacterium]|nr:AAA family ATPase [Chloroflexota bacterium]
MHAKKPDSRYEVSADALRYECDTSLFEFECTKDFVPLKEFIGQDRAIRAIEFGMNMADDGYNVFVTGMSGTGKSSMVKAHIEKLIKTHGRRHISDWCYIYNFDDPDVPKIVPVAQGKGKALQGKVKSMLEHIREDLEKAFGSDEYKAERKKIIEESRARQQAILEQMNHLARQQDFGIQISPVGPTLVPLVDGRPMEDREYHELAEPVRKKLDARQAELHSKMQASLENVASIEHETAGRLQQGDKRIGDYVISRLFSSLTAEYARVPKLKKYFADLKNHTLDNLGIFKMIEQPVNPMPGIPTGQVLASGRDPLIPFQINLFVDNSEAKCPPVVIETNPNFANMFGKIERKFLFGGYLSDHTMLKAGAVSRASGGYLLLNAVDILANPGVWPAFKRALKNKEVKIEDPFEQFGLIAPQGLRPEPMPISVKFVLTGDTSVYQTLSLMDEDFREIFKVKADFDHEIKRTRENVLAYAAFISGCCEACKARHFDPSGVGRVIEFSMRIVSDQEKLSSRFAFIKDLVEEANYWAGRDGKDIISAEHVQKAIEERLFRHNLPEERIQDMITRGTLMIDVDGAKVGQVNGLSVYSLGDIAFGKPSRITAQTFMGRTGVIDIERESELGGPIHSKGVMILSGYLGWKYAQDYPISLSASLCFEQSYGGVEGDSASSAELYAILSSISGIPIHQHLAVTGSVSQKGELQPIGGVNEKIEGFYDTCEAKGLTGKQGVLVPHLNMVNLMLKREVVNAVRERKFHVYAAGTIDEGIEILTGIPAGEKSPDGKFPKGTINYLVDNQLRKMAEKMRAYGHEDLGNGRRQTAAARVHAGRHSRRSSRKVR